MSNKVSICYTADPGRQRCRRAAAAAAALVAHARAEPKRASYSRTLYDRLPRRHRCLGRRTCRLGRRTCRHRRRRRRHCNRARQRRDADPRPAQCHSAALYIINNNTPLTAVKYARLLANKYYIIFIL